MSERKIEDSINEGLPLADQEIALNFVGYLRQQEFEFVRGDGYWKDKIYYLVKYCDKYICFIAMNDPDDKDNRWTVWSDNMDSVSSDEFQIERCLAEVAWRHVDGCGNCGSCSGGKSEVVFGKVFDKVCRCTFRIDNPTTEDLPFMKKIVEMRKKEIFNHSLCLQCDISSNPPRGRT